MDIQKFLSENLLLGRALIDLQSSNKGSNPLWTGFVSTNKGEIPAYIKQCRNSEGLCIEIISSLLGLKFGIPIPKPIIVLVEPGHPQIPVGSPTFLFGSQMYEMPSFERFLVDSDLTEDCILEYPKLSSIVAFDELIANPDRNNSNILYDGENYRFIDHEQAFHPKQNPHAPIDELNKIANISDIIQYHNGKNDIYIYNLMKKIKKIIQDDLNVTSSDAVLHSIKEVSMLNEYNVLVERVSNFLRARHNVLAVLVENAITNPPESAQLDLLGG